MTLSPRIMRRMSPGEGQEFFPYFFINIVLCAGLLLFFFSPPPLLAQKDPPLSRFDRLARQASELNQAAEYDKVIALLEPHKSDKKNDSALFFNELGVAYRNKEKYSQSIRAYEAALACKPENPGVVQKNLGDVFTLQGNYDRAIELYKEVIRLNPRFDGAHFGLGVAYYKLGKYDEALPFFDTAIRLNPRDEKARQFREVIQKKLKSQ